jgi:hypothetical protein
VVKIQGKRWKKWRALYDTSTPFGRISSVFMVLSLVFDQHLEDLK